jgi:hypothetical protein
LATDFLIGFSNGFGEDVAVVNHTIGIFCVSRKALLVMVESFHHVSAMVSACGRSSLLQSVRNKITMKGERGRERERERETW